MKERGRPLRVLGHPLHAPLTHFPLALWTAAFGADCFFLCGGDPFWWRFAFWCLLGGLAVGLLTLGTGFMDYVLIPQTEKAAEKTAVWHMAVMLTAAGLFSVSLYHHQLDSSQPVTRMIAFGFSAAGTLCLQVGGWLGGELVYRHGIGYNKDNSST